MAHLLLQADGDTTVAVDAAVYDITGDIDIAAWVAPDDWTANGIPIARRYTNVANATWQLTVKAAGTLELAWWDAGGTARIVGSSAATGFTDGTLRGIRVTLDVDNGAGGHVVQFFTTTDPPSAGDSATWTQLGTDQNAGAFTTSIRATDSPITVGGYLSTGLVPLIGQIHRARFKNGIDGTSVFDADPSDTSTWDCPDKLFFTDKANSATVTLQGNATLVGDCPSVQGAAGSALLLGI